MSPVHLPPGLVPPPVRLTLDEDLLANVRLERFSFLSLDSDENQLGTMLNVKRGGTLDWSSSTAIKGSGSITVVDHGGPEPDWLNLRIKPIAIMENGETRGLGVYLPAAPKEAWDSTGHRSWDVELLDKASILDQDIPTAPDGSIVTYAVPAGANVIATVKDLIASVGETSPAIMDDTVTLTSPMTWDLSTTILTVVNDLLEAAGYASLWCDGEGQFRAEPYLTPKERIPVYANLPAFSKSSLSLMRSEWQRDRDIYAIPNRYVAVAQGNERNEALIAVATNEDPESPFSFQARGRWITRVATGVEAASQEALDTRAKMGMAQASSVTNGISVEHLWLPDLRENSTIAFTNPDAGLDLLCYVTSTTLTLDPTSLCKSEIREAVV